MSYSPLLAPLLVLGLVRATAPRSRRRPRPVPHGLHAGRCSLPAARRDDQAPRRRAALDDGGLHARRHRRRARYVDEAWTRARAAARGWPSAGVGLSGAGVPRRRTSTHTATALLRLIPADQYDPRADMINELNGWDQVRASLAQAASAAPGNVVLASNHYSLCGRMLFEMGDCAAGLLPHGAPLGVRLLRATRSADERHRHRPHERHPPRAAPSACRAARARSPTRSTSSGAGCRVARYFVQSCRPVPGRRRASAPPATESGVTPSDSQRRRAWVDRAAVFEEAHRATQRSADPAPVGAAAGRARSSPSVFGYFASRLELRTRYDALLPDSQPSVAGAAPRRGAHGERADGAHPPRGARPRGPPRHGRRRRHRAARARARHRLERRGRHPGGARVPHAARRPLPRPRRSSSSSRDDVDARWDYEVAKEAGELLDDNGPPVTVEDIEKRFRKKAATGVQGADRGRGPPGRLLRAQGRHRRSSSVARSPIPGGDLAKTGPGARDRSTPSSTRCRRRGPSSPPIRVGYAGRHADGLHRVRPHPQRSARASARRASRSSSPAVLLYFMRLRALLVMGDHHRRGPRLDASASRSSSSVTSTWRRASSSASSPATASTSASSTSRGTSRSGARARPPSTRCGRRCARPGSRRSSRRSPRRPRTSRCSSPTSARSAHFGFIAASGMLLCWVVKTLMVPPAAAPARAAAADRRRRGRRRSSRRIRRFGMGYGRVFAWLVPKAPRLFFGGGVLAGRRGHGRRRAATCAATRWSTTSARPRTIPRQPRRAPPRLGRRHRHPRARATTAWSSSPTRRTRRDELEKQAPGRLGRARRRTRSRSSPCTRSGSIVPDDQEAKIPILLEIGERLERARGRGFIDRRRLGPK